MGTQQPQGNGTRRRTTTTGATTRTSSASRPGSITAAARRSTGASRRVSSVFTNHDQPKPVRHLTFDSESHWHVLCRMTGSVWPRVVPWCAVNLSLTCFLWLAKHAWGWDWTSNPSGHKYLSVLVSFLVISRVRIMYAAYMEQATELNALFNTSRELVLGVVCLTSPDRSAEAKEWRNKVCLAWLKLLRFTMALLEFRSQDATDLGTLLNLSRTEQQDLFLLPDDDNELFQQDGDDPDSSIRPAQLQQEPRTAMERACGAVPILAHHLRQEILQTRSEDGTCFTGSTIVLTDLVGAYLKSWAKLEKFITTPFPFPMIQMGKTVLVFWLFSLPFCICNDDDTSLAEKLVMIFLITFGFVGIESVSMELSDCFGDDPNDMDNGGLAAVCYEDCYVSIYKVDGLEWARRLKKQFVGYCQPSPTSVAAAAALVASDLGNLGLEDDEEHNLKEAVTGSMSSSSWLSLNGNDEERLLSGRGGGGTNNGDEEQQQPRRLWFW